MRFLVALGKGVAVYGGPCGSKNVPAALPHCYFWSEEGSTFSEQYLTGMSNQIYSLYIVHFFLTFLSKIEECLDLDYNLDMSNLW